MNYKSFSKKELVDMLDIIQTTLACKNENDIHGVLTRVNWMVSADYGVCGLGEVDSNQLTRILRIVNADYPEEWLNLYGSEKLFEKDPIIRYNFRFFKSQLWSEAIEVFSEEPYLEFMHTAGDFGLKYGVASGVCGPACNRGSIFSFSGDKRRFHLHHKKILDIVTPHIHQALVNICETARTTECKLTEREKEIIRWMKEGKTNWEISVILKISERTVKFHIQNIERKLDAVNKAHAVAIALDQRLVT